MAKRIANYKPGLSDGLWVLRTFSEDACGHVRLVWSCTAVCDGGTSIGILILSSLAFYSVLGWGGVVWCECAVCIQSVRVGWGEVVVVVESRWVEFIGN